MGTSHLFPVECNHPSLYVKSIWLWVDNTDRQVPELRAKRRTRKLTWLHPYGAATVTEGKTDASSYPSQEEVPGRLRKAEEKTPHESRCFPSQEEPANSNKPAEDLPLGERLTFQHREEHAHWLAMALHGWSLCKEAFKSMENAVQFDIRLSFQVWKTRTIMPTVQSRHRY